MTGSEVGGKYGQVCSGAWVSGRRSSSAEWAAGIVEMCAEVAAGLKLPSVQSTRPETAGRGLGGSQQLRVERGEGQ